MICMQTVNSVIKTSVLHFRKISDVTLTIWNLLYTGSKIIKWNQETAANWMKSNQIASPDLDPVIFFYSIKISVLLFGFATDTNVWITYGFHCKENSSCLKTNNLEIIYHESMAQHSL